MKKFTFLILGAFLLVGSITNAQFVKEYYKATGVNTRFHAITPVSAALNSDLYLVGNYGDQLFVSQIKQSGNVVWTRRLMVNDPDFMVNSLLVDSDGKLVFCGGESTGIDDNSNGFIAKFDPVTTTLMWFQQTPNVVACFDIVEGGVGGNYYVGGQEEGVGTGNQADHLVLSVDRTTGATTVISNLNKHINETAQCIAFDNGTSSLYTSGRYELNIGAAKFRICLTKMDEAGVVDFSKYYIKDLGSTGRFYTEDMLVDGENVVMVGCGDDGGTSIFKNLFFLRTNLGGDIQDIYRYDITATANDGILCAIKKYADGYIMFGLLNNGVEADAFLMNVDLNGDIVWAKSYDYKKKSNPSGYYATGSLAIIGDNLFHVGEREMLDGSIRGIFLKSPIATGDAGNCDVDLTMTKTEYASPYSNNADLVAVTSAPVFVESEVAIKNQNFFNTQICFVNGKEEAFEQSTIFSNEPESNQILVYPSPNNGTFVLSFNDGIDAGILNLTITNIAGQVVYANESYYELDEINITDQVNGMYFATVRNGVGEIVASCSFVLEM